MRRRELLLAAATGGLLSRRAGAQPPPRSVRIGWLTAQRPASLVPFVQAFRTSLADLGFEVSLAAGESHLCCGSAGTYSVLQPELATRLRDRKLEWLEQAKPDAIVSANVGCIQHLQSGTTTPVRHWIEVVDQALA